jgi:tetratricopeptide (TPR) repeat protein
MFAAKIDYTIRGPEVILFSVLLIALSLMTVMRNLNWETDFTLWNDVVENSPQKWRPHLKVGLLFYRERSTLERAIEEFEKALELKPDAYEFHNNIGLSYQRMGLLYEAEREYMLAIEKGTRPFSATLNLGTLYLERGDPERALEWFLRAVDLEPKNTSALSNAGFTYGDLGEYERAIEMHTKALSESPYYYNAHYGLGLAYEGVGHLDRAAFHFEEYLRKAPGKGVWKLEVQRHLKRLRSMEGGRR